MTLQKASLDGSSGGLTKESKKKKSTAPLGGPTFGGMTGWRSGSDEEEEKPSKVLAWPFRWGK